MPNCMILGLSAGKAAVVIRPKVPASRFVFGLPQLKLLNRLNTSTRNSSDRAEAIGTRRDSARSTVQKPGPWMLKALWLPSVPGAGYANAAGFRYRVRDD